MMITAARFLLYGAFSSLAKYFLDREVKRRLDPIFEQVDKALPAALATGQPDVVDGTITAAIAAAGIPNVDARQVRQVLDLFDPIAFAGRALR
jgi:hypothetical protein